MADSAGGTDRLTLGKGGGFCPGEYVGCGCQCRDQTKDLTEKVRCSYPAAGESLESVTAADLAKKNGPSCSCGGADHYICSCSETAVEPAGSATYNATRPQPAAGHPPRPRARETHLGKPLPGQRPAPAQADKNLPASATSGAESAPRPSLSSRSHMWFRDACMLVAAVYPIEPFDHRASPRRRWPGRPHQTRLRVKVELGSVWG